VKKEHWKANRIWCHLWP